MNRGKDLTEVRSPQRQLAPDKVGPEQSEPTFLRGIAIKARSNKRHRFRDLYRCLNEELIYNAWKSLNKGAASGVDRVTAEAYAEDLQGNIQRLVERLKAKRYRAKLVRRVYIPKENGKQRPLGIPALEDRLVQSAVTKVLTAIYEQDFLDCSYGYRAGRSAHDAVSVLTRELQFGPYHTVVEADIRGFFDHMDHDWLVEMLEQRIDDRAFLGLIRKWLKAGILETDGKVINPETGTPQGGIVSPILANVYLHYVLDLWFDRVVKRSCRGKAVLVRYADDWVCAFEHEDDAERFYQVLPARLKKFGLEIALEKTNKLRFSRRYLSKGQRFIFVGFEFYWEKDRKGQPRVKRRTAPRKLQGASRRIKAWIKKARHLSKRDFARGLNRRLTGHYNYFGVIGNGRSINRFYLWAMECTFKWLNRRGGKRQSFTRETFWRTVDRGLFRKPRITAGMPRRVLV
jgi:group II intron reverse transcriptase/maturase